MTKSAVISKQREYAGCFQDQTLLIAIGASAGGPGAIGQILECIPPNFKAAIVIVQHFDSKMSQDLVNWWSARSKLPIRCALENDIPQAGEILLACGPQHLVLNSRQRLVHRLEPSESAYSPSIDQLFLSIAKYWQGAAVGVILTGMGADGALGLQALKARGFKTIAQSGETCAVFGMPKAAIKAGATSEIVDLKNIATRLVFIESALQHANAQK